MPPESQPPEQLKDARQAARAWIDHLREQHAAAAGEPVLWYYRDQWYIWTGLRWQTIDASYLSLRLARFLLSGTDDGNLTNRFLDQILLNLRAEALLEHWETPPPFRIGSRDPLQLHPGRFLQFDNGVLKLDARGKKHFTNASSRYFIPAAVPCEYDPDARCPTWRKFLDAVLPEHEPQPDTAAPDDDANAADADDVPERTRRQAVLQDAVLASLLGERHHHPLLILAGTARGANGKSTLLHVWQSLLDPASVSHMGFDALDQPDAIAAMDGPHLNVANELPDRHRLPRQALTRLLRGEPFELLRPHRPPRRVEPTPIWVASVSQLPELTVADRRWWRRTLIIPFDRTMRPNDADPHLARRIIQAELPGIVNWALEAAPRLIKGKPAECPRCSQLAMSHATLNDPVEQFIDECCTVGGSSSKDPRDAIYHAYVEYCRTRLGPGIKPLVRAQFGQRLRQYGVGEARASTPLDDGRRPRYYTGIALSVDGIALLRQAGYADLNTDPAAPD